MNTPDLIASASLWNVAALSHRIASRAGAFCPGSVIFVRIANTRHYPLPLFKMASPGNLWNPLAFIQMA
jgi:hypothetical protein